MKVGRFAAVFLCRGGLWPPAGRSVPGPYKYPGMFCRGGCPHPPVPKCSDLPVGAAPCGRPYGGYRTVGRDGLGAPPYICGPVWDRPLRRSPDRFPYFCRGGTPGRPFPGRPVSGPYGIPDTSPFFVGAGPRPAPAQKSGPAWGRFPHIYWGMSMRTPHTRI